ncbi:hypothetical protein Scani_58380 [Streptomyces caniferus]|uniref:Uncharacterized protein n=1 Tax=Streptomyces caniferus TaxID=285557 RepID=A0A640SEU3_9ACTN|nr:hypothetical protein Scani_58380 [Streptomyces caniferus]
MCSGVASQGSGAGYAPGPAPFSGSPSLPVPRLFRFPVRPEGGGRPVVGERPRRIPRPRTGGCGAGLSPVEPGTTAEKGGSCGTRNHATGPRHKVHTGRTAAPPWRASFNHTVLSTIV